MKNRVSDTIFPFAGSPVCQFTGQRVHGPTGERAAMRQHRIATWSSWGWGQWHTEWPSGKRGQTPWQLPIGFAAMANSVDDHTADRVLNRIEDSIVTDTEPVRVARALQFLGVRGSGVVCEGFDRILETGTDPMGEAAELSGGRRCVEDRVHGRVALGLQRGVDLRHRDEPVAPMGFEVGQVFQVFQQVDQPPELAQGELDSAPAPLVVYHKLGMELHHCIPTISHGLWGVKRAEFRGQDTELSVQR